MTEKTGLTVLAEFAAKQKKPKRVRPPSRPQRWASAASNAADAIAKMREAQSDLEEAVSELHEVQQEYSDWNDNLPDNLRNSPLGEKLEEIVNLDIENLADNVTNAIDEAEMQSFFGRKRLPGQDELIRLLRADKRRQHDGGEGREDAHLHLRLQKLCVGGRDHQIAEGDQL